MSDTDTNLYGTIVGGDPRRRVIVRWHREPDLPDGAKMRVLRGWLDHVKKVRLIDDHNPELHWNPTTVDSSGYTNGGGVETHSVSLIQRDWAVVTLSKTAFEYQNSREHASNCSDDFIAGVEALARVLAEERRATDHASAVAALERAGRLFDKKRKRFEVDALATLEATSTWSSDRIVVSYYDEWASIDTLPDGFFPTERYPANRMTKPEAAAWCVRLLREHRMRRFVEAVRAAEVRR